MYATPGRPRTDEGANHCPWYFQVVQPARRPRCWPHVVEVYCSRLGARVVAVRPGYATEEIAAIRVPRPDEVAGYGLFGEASQHESGTATPARLVLGRDRLVDLLERCSVWKPLKTPSGADHV